ncbi:hypothetical protein WN48_05220 [Eufriesea mexicana]|uniref:CCHC-type domain-containing protein n=1 Tax=Eufriesea mexicana TaxID=516756 RepID=A0A310SN06_9HYME|nr:hypothetical protein WN48_05220 [Eufriesea mexicana]
MCARVMDSAGCEVSIQVTDGRAQETMAEGVRVLMAEIADLREEDVSQHAVIADLRENDATQQSVNTSLLAELAQDAARNVRASAGGGEAAPAPEFGMEAALAALSPRIDAKVADCTEAEIRAGVIRPSASGQCTVWAQCPLAAAVDYGRICVGWTSARDVALEARCLHSFRCLAFGHARKECSSAVDHTDICLRCGAAGHRTGGCIAPAPKCPDCAGHGRPSNLRLGSKPCFPPKAKCSAVLAPAVAASASAPASANSKAVSAISVSATATAKGPPSGGAPGPQPAQKKGGKDSFDFSATHLYSLGFCALPCSNILCLALECPAIAVSDCQIELGSICMGYAWMDQDTLCSGSSRNSGSEASGYVMLPLVRLCLFALGRDISDCRVINCQSMDLCAVLPPTCPAWRRGVRVYLESHVKLELATFGYVRLGRIILGYLLLICFKHQCAGFRQSNALWYILLGTVDVSNSDDSFGFCAIHCNSASFCALHFSTTICWTLGMSVIDVSEVRGMLGYVWLAYACMSYVWTTLTRAICTAIRWISTPYCALIYSAGYEEASNGGHGALVIPMPKLNILEHSKVPKSAVWQCIAQKSKLSKHNVENRSTHNSNLTNTNVPRPQLLPPSPEPSRAF